MQTVDADGAGYGQRRRLMVRGAVMGIAALAGAVTVGQNPAGSAMFLGGSSGTAVPYTVVPLPEVSNFFGQNAPPPDCCPFVPTFNDLVSTGHVVATEAQMKYVWRRLFTVPYDAGLFDFSSSFVVLMGQSLEGFGSFSIVAVEEFETSYQCPSGFCDGRNGRALAVTGNLTVGGANPGDPPPQFYFVSAVRIDKQYLEDVVFHKTTFYAP